MGPARKAARGGAQGGMKGQAGGEAGPRGPLSVGKAAICDEIIIYGAHVFFHVVLDMF